MANEKHLKILKQGVEAWNAWRRDNRDVRPDLMGAHLRDACLHDADLRNADLREAKLTGAKLTGADLFEANLFHADLRGANLYDACLERVNLSGADLTSADLFQANIGFANLTGANLTEADLTLADLSGTDFTRADLIEAKLRGATLHWADLTGADLVGADLAGADLREANLTKAKLNGAYLARADLVETNLQDAELTACNIYGISVWDVEGVPKDQSGLVITPDGTAAVTVDDLKVAQFVYLLLYNPNIRDVIDTIGKKGVLILGRFGERLKVLNALRQKLRETGYVPMVFDFERAESQDFTETVMTLAGMSAFVIADITKPRSVQQELTATIPDYMIPFVPIIEDGEEPYSMFVDLQNKYDKWVLELLVYDDVDQLVRVADGEIIAPAEDRRRFLLAEKAKGIQKRYARDSESLQ